MQPACIKRLVLLMESNNMTLARYQTINKQLHKTPLIYQQALESNRAI